MIRALGRGVKRVILWDYPRASWQYDVIVVAILGFIFLTPRETFRDQPRIANASTIAMLPAENGRNVFWIEPELLPDPDGDAKTRRLASLLRDRTGRTQVVVGLEPIYDSDKELKGYMAFTRP